MPDQYGKNPMGAGGSEMRVLATVLRHAGDFAVLLAPSVTTVKEYF
jgi:hypothetical protein